MGSQIGTSHGFDCPVRRPGVVCCCVAVIAIAAGCAAPRVNPSFDVSTRDARAAMRAMREDRVPLARPLVILGGFSDPGFAAAKVRGAMRQCFARADERRVIAVNFPWTGSFDECRRRVTRAVDAAFPTHDPEQTAEVDVIGISMGGLVARVAAEDAPPGERRLRVARLFTIASPLRGARLAARHPIALTSMHRDMRAGSPLLARLNARAPEYPVVSYTRLNDSIVGEAYAAPAGQGVWWLDNGPLEHAHWAAIHDPRILADIARRLRGEAPLTTDPPAPLPAPRDEGRQKLARRGRETLAAIEREYRIADSPLYVEQLDDSNRPAFCWPAGVQLSALAAAARVDDAYEPRLRAFADALQQYRTEARGIAGLDVLPGPKPSDRYYDDNAWVVLGLIETYEVTRDARYFERAEELFRFVLSGEDDALGGGIWWRENDRNSKNTCSNAPAIVAALRLHQLTRDPSYLETAQRLYAWTNDHLQDEDGLFFDNVGRGGTVERTKWSYNSALMIRANALLWCVTREARYREEASRIATAAAARWVRSRDGAVTDESPFAHLLLDAFCDMSEIDAGGPWRGIASRAAEVLHDRFRDARGYFGKRFDAPPAPGVSPRLIDQASAARVFWRLSWSNQSSSRRAPHSTTLHSGSASRNSRP